ncbi:MAG: M1 family metallopeptidase, partial [Rhodocyclaceae bacterium]
MKVFVVAFLFCLACATPPVVASDAAAAEYHLAVDIEPEAGRLVGRAVLQVERAGTVILGVGGLHVTALVVDGRKRSVPTKGSELRVVARKTVEIAYERHFTANGEDRIDRDEVLLTGGWYPAIDGPVRYAIEATLPHGWHAIAESDTWATEDLGAATRHRFAASFPITDGVTLVASPHYAITTRRHGDILLETWLMPEFAANASVYLERMEALLDDYQSKFDVYPHRRLALVEAHIPSSLSMPGFVLMNPGSLRDTPRLTTLAHEMVHQWFGNATYIAFGEGNWAEGAAIYFADHLLDQQDGKGWRCRKRMLQGYHNLVAGRAEIPLARFAARESDSTRWIGYGKGALVFHALRNEIGEEDFYAAIRDFLARHRFRAATWQDL